MSTALMQNLANPFILSTHELGLSKEGQLTLQDRNPNPFARKVNPVKIALAVLSASEDLKNSLCIEQIAKTLREAEEEILVGCKPKTVEFVQEHFSKAIKRIDPSSPLRTLAHPKKTQPISFKAFSLLTGTAGWLTLLATTVYSICISRIYSTPKPGSRLRIPRSLLPSSSPAGKEASSKNPFQQTPRGSFASQATHYSAPAIPLEMKSGKSFAQMVREAYPAPVKKKAPFKLPPPGTEIEMKELRSTGNGNPFVE